MGAACMDLEDYARAVAHYEDTITIFETVFG